MGDTIDTEQWTARENTLQKKPPQNPKTKNLWVRAMTKTGPHSQKSEGEHEDETQPSRLREFQLPDDWDREDQNHKVGRGVESSRGNKASISVPTHAFDGEVPVVGKGPTEKESSHNLTGHPHPGENHDEPDPFSEGGIRSKNPKVKQHD